MGEGQGSVSECERNTAFERWLVGEAAGGPQAEREEGEGPELVERVAAHVNVDEVERGEGIDDGGQPPGETGRSSGSHPSVHGNRRNDESAEVS